MRAALLVVVAVFGCSKKAEQKREATPAERVETKRAETKPADPPAAPEAKPAEPAPAAPAKFDCAAIVTAEDFKKACNAAVEIEPTLFEGKGSLTMCSRRIRQADHKDSSTQWTLATFAGPDAIDRYFNQDTLTQRTPLAGVGDQAWTGHRTLSATGTKEYDVMVRKGNVLLAVGHSITSQTRGTPCTEAQLIEVAKAALARLP
jgi:hypothetical protein